jgi:hypothetical protein
MLEDVAAVHWISEGDFGGFSSISEFAVSREKSARTAG